MSRESRLRRWGFYSVLSPTGLPFLSGFFIRPWGCLRHRTPSKAQRAWDQLRGRLPPGLALGPPRFALGPPLGRCCKSGIRAHGPSRPIMWPEPAPLYPQTHEGLRESAHPALPHPARPRGQGMSTLRPRTRPEGGVFLGLPRQAFIVSLHAKQPASCPPTCVCSPGMQSGVYQAQ